MVESKRGKIRAKALVTKGINPGTVCMERFWHPETMNTKTHGWQETNVNVLSKSTAPFNDVLVLIHFVLIRYGFRKQTVRRKASGRNRKTL